MNYFERMQLDPLWAASQASAKKVFLGTPTPEDHHIVALYSALEDKTRELRVMTLKLALLAEHEPIAWAVSTYAQLMQRVGKA